ncbi:MULTISPECIES: ABC transporter permease [unclassified Mesotoga]|uniref:ABC transporter permease n=1 Tax=unclassified Mesotoga TaxID=1184398 RepID=UPI000DBF7928|nr:ABC transporter permease [Mesotoga sp. UBA5825]RAM59280.1 ABC transporter [Mesotoga sp. SC_3PWM13N19]
MRLFTNTLKEIKLGWRSHFFLLTVGLAVAYFLLMTFLIPEDLSTDTQLVLMVEQEELATTMGLIEEDTEISLSFAKDREELDKMMNRNFNSIGIVIGGDRSYPSVELVFQGHETAETREFLKLLVSSYLAGSFNSISDSNVEYLQEIQETRAEIPLNKSFLPVFLMFEAVMMGMIMVFAMIFSEKSQSTLHAYSVTPGKIWEYLGAKVILLVILGVIFTLILTPLTVGLKASFLPLIVVVAVGSFLSSSVSLIAASFYKNLSQSMAAMLALTVVFSLPMLSYFLDGFSPWYLRVLPTYPILFSLKAAVFPELGYVETSGVVLVTIEAVAAFLIAVTTYKLRLRKV